MGRLVRPLQTASGAQAPNADALKGQYAKSIADFDMAKE
jgi:hypothetical protein